MNLEPTAVKKAVQTLIWGLGASLLLLIAAGLLPALPDLTYLLPMAITTLSVQASFTKGIPAEIKRVNVVYVIGVCAVLAITGGTSGIALAALALGPLLHLSLRLPTTPLPLPLQNTPKDHIRRR